MIVLTGATGHLGNNLLKYLIKEGFKVKVIVRRIDESIKNLPIEYVLGNFNDIKLLEKTIFKGDIVIHLAAQIDTKNKKGDNSLDYINYEGTRIIADYSLKVGVKKFIYSSSSDAIYKTKNNSIINELSTINPDLLKDNYGRSKAKATLYLRKLKQENKDFNLSIIYPTACFGINDFKPSEVGKVIKGLIKSKIMFSINGHYNFVDMKDISYGIINIIKYDKEGEYIFSGNIISVKELYQGINKALNKKRPIIPVPFFLAYLGIPFVKVLSSQVLSLIRENVNYSSAKAINELGYTITPFEESIKNTVEWFKK